EVRRDRDAATAADLHARDALVPAGDHLAAAEADLEVVAASPGRGKVVAGLPRDADVVHLDDAAGRRLVAVADRQVLELQLVGGRAVGDGDLGLLGGVHASRRYRRTGFGLSCTLAFMSFRQGRLAGIVAIAL